MINLDTPWLTAVDELTALPPDLQARFGEVNFLCAARHRRNARRLYDGGILPLLREGGEYEVLLGFVDRALAESGEDLGGPPLEGMSEFLAARLRHSGTGLVVEVRAPDA